MITIRHKGDFSKTYRFLEKGRRVGERLNSILSKYAAMGVQALSAATPKDSGKTAIGWTSEITKNREGYSIVWSNTNENDGVSIALLIQYGHGLQNGSYIEGRDFINPAMRPIFEGLSKDILREVSSL